MAFLLRLLAAILLLVGLAYFLGTLVLIAMVLSNPPVPAIPDPFGPFDPFARLAVNVGVSGILAGVGGILWAVTVLAYPPRSKDLPPWFFRAREDWPSTQGPAPAADQQEL
jgi:hypothetical protein